MNNFTKISVSGNDLDKIVTNSSFENLKRLEDKGMFDENSINSSTGESKVFFNMGVKNDWRILLDSKSRSLIEEKFKYEMTELGYL